MSENFQAWRTLVEILEGILSGGLGITEGCRKVVSLQHQLGQEDNELFLPFVAVDSDTDAFPLGNVQEKWSRPALARVNSERSDVEKYYRSSVQEAATKLLSHAKQNAL